MADQGQKTEQPTHRRIEKARREGNFPTSKEFIAGLQFTGFVAVLAAWGPDWFFQVRQTTRGLLLWAFSSSLDSGDLIHLSQDLLIRTFLPLAVAGGLVMAATVGIQLASTGMGVSLAKLTPDLKRLSPAARLKEIVRNNIPAFVRAVVLIPFFTFAVYFVVQENLGLYLTLPLQSVEAGLMQVGVTLEGLLWKAVVVFMILGLIDLTRQRRRYTKDLRMTKQEVKDEMKETEGNPLIKAQIRRLRRDMLRRNMMKQVPKATAVIVNPTHYAVALRYDMDTMAAPKVVAKGKNYLARRIRELALQHQVPIIENPPLAQALYKSVEVGQEIPPALYRAVAEVLAYIYQLLHRRRFSR